jgi:hypothetical protein
MLADLLSTAESDLQPRLESQAEVLRETPCTDPSAYGRLVAENDVTYLLAVLSLKDESFVAEFPAAAQFDESERRQFVAALEAHIDDCPHCSIKRGYDLEMGARVEQACRQNSGFLLEVLDHDGGGEADTPGGSGQGGSGEAKSGRAARAGRR